MRAAVAVAAVGCAAVLLSGAKGCTSTSSSSDDGGGGSSAVAPATTSSGDGGLSCDRWLHSYSSADRLGLSKIIIADLHAYDQSTEFAQTFADDISEDCQPVPSMSVADVAAALATLDTNDFPR